MPNDLSKNEVSVPLAGIGEMKGWVRTYRGSRVNVSVPLAGIGEMKAESTTTIVAFCIKFQSPWRGLVRWKEWQNDNTVWELESFSPLGGDWWDESIEQLNKTIRDFRVSVPLAGIGEMKDH